MPIDFRLSYDEYWDFCLNTDINLNLYQNNKGLHTDCLISYIDINDSNCVWFNDLYSKSDFIWENSVNNGINNNYIGYTGVDNGIISYEKDRISNQKFYELYTNSKLVIENGDMRFHLHKVSGNNMIFDYESDIVSEDNILCTRLNGGFYQGFFKLYNEDYQILPDSIGDGVYFEFTIKKSEFTDNNKLLKLNDRYPDNKGIFFYIGTRSENKWFINYDVTDKIDYINNSYVSEDYVNSDYFPIDTLNENYIKPYNDVYNKDGYFNTDYLLQDGNNNCNVNNEYFADDYVSEDYFKVPCDICNMYVKPEYYNEEMVINPDEIIYTSEGYDFAQPNIKEIKTDNKFIFFNRTEDGFTTETWNEGDEVILTDINIPDMENYFLLFNHTKNGYTIKNIDELKYKKSKQYSILDDILYNALAFQITDNGNVGYKYMVRDCDKTEKAYKIEREFSKNDIIKNNQWNTIGVKILPISNNNMKLYFYVNGKLCLVSKELPILKLKQLNDVRDKQVSVPYNISLGGGTQGLCDVIYMNYRQLPKYVLPLEKEFAGTFIGYIKSFKIYNCLLNINDIQENFNFEKSFNS